MERSVVREARRAASWSAWLYDWFWWERDVYDGRVCTPGWEARGKQGPGSMGLEDGGCEKALGCGVKAGEVRRPKAVASSSSSEES